VRVVAEAARHLHYAHQEGFIHRDVKPANILVNEQGQVYVTDFGIAVTEEEVQLRSADGSGTLAYMSPEQLHGYPFTCYLYEIQPYAVGRDETDYPPVFTPLPDAETTYGSSLGYFEGVT